MPRCLRVTKLEGESLRLNSRLSTEISRVGIPLDGPASEVVKIFLMKDKRAFAWTSHAFNEPYLRSRSAACLHARPHLTSG